MYQFTPPVAYRQPFSERSPLWCRVSVEVPYTVVKTNTGAYVQELEHNPDRPGIVTVYEGGHVYTVDDDEAARLTAAGYTVIELVEDVALNGYVETSRTASSGGMVPTPGYSEMEAETVQDLLNGYLNIT